MIFEVTPEHIERLTDTDLRELIGRLAVQEAVRRGHSPAGVTYGGHQNSKDGGIDVAVDLTGDCDGYIRRPNTGFQVKAEDMPRAAILKEMRPKPKHALRPAIVELGKKNGAYVIVSSKGSVSQTSLTDRRNAMAAAIADVPEAETLELDFYDRTRIATWVNQHPGLIPWVRQKVGLSLVGWRPFADWSASPGKDDEVYVLDDRIRLVGVRFKDEGGLGTEAGVNRLRQILAQPKGAVRLVGLSGVGKTLRSSFIRRSRGRGSLRPQLGRLCRPVRWA